MVVLESGNRSGWVCHLKPEGPLPCCRAAPKFYPLYFGPNSIVSRACDDEPLPRHSLLTWTALAPDRRSWGRQAGPSAAAAPVGKHVMARAVHTCRIDDARSRPHHDSTHHIGGSWRRLGLLGGLLEVGQPIVNDGPSASASWRYWLRHICRTDTECVRRRIGGSRG